MCSTFRHNLRRNTTTTSRKRRENEHGVDGSSQRGGDRVQARGEIVEAAGTGLRIAKNTEQKQRKMVEAAGVEPEKR